MFAKPVYLILSQIVFGAAFVLSSFLFGQETGGPGPVPDSAAVQRALEEVRDLFGEDYAKAKTDEQRLAVAEAIFKEGLTSDYGPAERYALLRVARDMASGSGDADLAFAAIEALAKNFQIDPLPMRVDVLKKAAGGLRLPSDHLKFLPVLKNTFEEAIAKDRHDLARQIGQMATASAARSRNPIARKEVAQQLEELERLEKAATGVPEALATLETDPTNADANLVVGKYLCLVKGDWDRGLPMLALGSDPALKGLAEQELLEPADFEPQAALADGWWNLAEKQEGDKRRALRGRAAQWYERAVGGLKGLRKASAETRIKTAALEQQDADAVSGSHRRKHPAKIAVNCDDLFRLCVNGQEVLSGADVKRVFTEDLELGSGDVITAWVKNNKSVYGFCCVIQFKTGQSLTTGPNWMGYTPASTSEWFAPQGIKSIYPVVGLSKGKNRKVLPSDYVLKATKIAAPTIWGKGNPCYLVCRIP